MMPTIVLNITTRYELDLHSGRITHPRWSPEGGLLAVPTDSGSIVIFDMESGAVARTLGPHSGPVTSVTWNRSSDRLLSSSLDGSVGHWEVATGLRGRFTITGHTQPVRFVEWTDEEAFAMTCSADRIRAWDGCCLLPGWDQEMEERANQYTDFSVASCSNRTSLLLAMAAKRGRVLILTNLMSGELVASLEMAEPVRCLCWSPADELLAVGTDSSISIFRCSHEGFGESPVSISRQSSQLHAVAFSSDGTLLASRDDEGLKIWDVETSALAGEVKESIKAFSGIAFHPAEPLLATSSADAARLRILELA